MAKGMGRPATRPEKESNKLRQSIGAGNKTKHPLADKLNKAKEDRKKK